MKIAFIGSHGVGKTTLCFDLASRLKRLDLGVDIVKEVARACPLPINEATTLEAQAWILHTQIAEEIAAANQYDAVICARSVLDNYAYMVQRAGRKPQYDELVRSWVGTYTGLFKVPVLQPPQRRLHLLGMVPVVVDDGDAADLALHLEAAVDALEGRARARRDLEGDAELAGDGDDGERVLRVVATRHAQ